MPEGVEHYLSLVTPSLLIFAFPSLMPEGVEHILSPEQRDLIRTAFPSLMPEGVEHHLGHLYAIQFVARFLR